MGVNMSTETRRSPTPFFQPNKATSQSGLKAIPNKKEWESHFNACKNTNKLLVMYFTATWCGPCKFMEPILEELCQKFPDVDFIKIDVDEVPDVATDYGVCTVPTFLLMKRGDQVDSVVGARKEDLQKKIENHRKSNYTY